MISASNLMRQTEHVQQRIQSIAFVVSVYIAIYLAIGFVVSSSWVGKQANYIGLEDKINPNYAPVASLARLPGIGIVRAEAIIAYRDTNSGNEGLVFLSCDDLQRVKGIGPKTAQSLSQWLKFE